MFPNNASKMFSPEVKSAPTASDNVNKTPTKVSTGSFVLCSTTQIIKAPKIRKTRAPKKILKLNKIPKAIPGSATCERASETSAILRSKAKDPRSPEAAATVAATINVLIKIMSCIKTNINYVDKIS